MTSLRPHIDISLFRSLDKGLPGGVSLALGYSALQRLKAGLLSVHHGLTVFHRPPPQKTLCGVLRGSNGSVFPNTVELDLNTSIPVLIGHDAGTSYATNAIQSGSAGVVPGVVKESWRGVSHA